MMIQYLQTTYTQERFVHDCIFDFLEIKLLELRKKSPLIDYRNLYELADSFIVFNTFVVKKNAKMLGDRASEFLRIWRNISEHEREIIVENILKDVLVNFIELEFNRFRGELNG